MKGKGKKQGGRGDQERGWNELTKPLLTYPCKGVSRQERREGRNEWPSKKLNTHTHTHSLTHCSPLPLPLG